MNKMYTHARTPQKQTNKHAKHTHTHTHTIFLIKNTHTKTHTHHTTTNNNNTHTQTQTHYIVIHLQELTMIHCQFVELCAVAFQTPVGNPCSCARWRAVSLSDEKQRWKEKRETIGTKQPRASIDDSHSYPSFEKKRWNSLKRNE